MNTKTKTVLLTAAALLMTAGTSMAAPRHWNNNHGKGINGYERVQIARSAASLASLKRRVWRDGRVTFFERIQLRNAERRHTALVRRAYRS